MSRSLVFGIVEDNREDFQALCRVLGPGHDVRRWQTAEQALAACRHGHLDELALLFVDCNLPGVDGIELVSQLRAVPGGDAAKIVVFSGSVEPELDERATRAGADRFEHKGSSIAEFRAAVDRCLALLDPAA